jgi:hypothetical protein
MASSLSFTAAEACDVNEATESPAKRTVENTTAIFIYFTPLFTAGSYARTPCKAQSGLLPFSQACRNPRRQQSYSDDGQPRIWPNHKINAQWALSVMEKRPIVTIARLIDGKPLPLLHL